MKPSEMRALSIDELRQKEGDLRKELFNLRFQLSKGELQSNSSVLKVRKDIARILTIITEKGAPAGAGKRSGKDA
ncbi:MAG: 50S ribosomal protein L29 [Nitrospirae bacterium]|nr:50S ribosomal protein L29 [Nitrospirota bacterium]